MKKMMMVAACAAITLLTGCGGSPISVAENFAKAVIKRDADKAISYYDTDSWSKKSVKDKKEEIDEAGKKIDDKEFSVVVKESVIKIPAEKSGYKIINGKEFKGEEASVTLQCIKGKDLKKMGLVVVLRKMGGKWAVEDFDLQGNMDTDE